MRNHRLYILYALFILMLVGTVFLSSCVTGIDINTDFSKIIDETPPESDPDGSRPPVAGPNQTETPVVKKITNMEKTVVAISGTCEEGSVITITGAIENDVVVDSVDSYFIAKVEIPSRSVLIQVSAKVPDKEESHVVECVAPYSAIAEGRQDGNNISVLPGSVLMFDSHIADYKGDDLYTMSKLSEYKAGINSKLRSMTARAAGHEFEYIYVFVPNANTYLYPNQLPDGTTRETYTTKYEQILSVTKETEVTVIDMLEVYNSLSDPKYDIFRQTDSALTEYGGYLIVDQICSALEKRFPEAASHSIDEYDAVSVDSKGGNLVSYLGHDTDLIREKIISLQPKNINYNIGKKDTDVSSINLSTIQKYVGEDDYSLFTGKKDGIIAANNTLISRTDRYDLPSALIYRDANAYPYIDMLMERFNNVRAEQADSYVINLTEAVNLATTYEDGTKNTVVDYIIVIVSENDLDRLF